MCVWGGGFTLVFGTDSHILMRRLSRMIYESGRLNKAAKTKQPGGDKLAWGGRGGKGERPSPSDIIQTNHRPERTISFRQSMNISLRLLPRYTRLHSVWLQPVHQKVC